MVINKNGVQKNKTKSKQIESPTQSEATANCFGYYIKDYLKDFYQKEDSDQESIIGNKKKNLTKYISSSSDSDTDYSDDDDSSRNYKKKVIKKCDKLKKKSRKKMQKLINYSRDHWNLFNNDDSDINENTKKRNSSSNSKKYIDEECQQYKSNQKSCSVYVWRSIFIIGCLLLIIGLIMSTSFLFIERQVVIGSQEEMEIIDRDAVKFNKILNQARAFSLALISVGLLLIVSTLLLPALVGVSLNCFRKPKDQTFASFFNDDRTDEDEQICSKVFVKSDKTTKNGARSKKLKNLEEPIKDNISKIPIIEEISSVQPQREQNESMMTSEGFAKLN